MFIECSMSTVSPVHRVTNDGFEFNHIDIPEQREYDDEADAQFDESMLKAIRKAREADVTPTAQVLEYQLGSHYMDTR